MTLYQLTIARIIVILAFFTAADRVFAQSDLVSEANITSVGIISGNVTGTYARIAQNIADALDNPGKLRVIAMLGKGSLQNIKDLLWLRGVDIAIVQSDSLAYYKKTNEIPDIGKKIRYIAKLYNEEVHIIARKDIASIKDLNGKKVNIGNIGSGTAMTSQLVFSIEDINIQPLHLANSEALSALRSGAIDAAVFVAGKPATFFREIEAGSGLHFINIELTKGLEESYLDAVLTNEDYPNLIPKDQKVETIAVGSVLAVYNWPKGSNRYERTALLVKNIFDSLPVLQTDAYHPKWKEVDLNSSLPGWERFGPAEDWLKANRR